MKIFYAVAKPYRKKLKRMAIVVLTVVLFLIAAIGLIKNLYNENTLRQRVINYFQQKNIEVSFDVLHSQLSWHPAIVLKNVRLHKRIKDVEYTLAAKELSIAFEWRYLLLAKAYRIVIQKGLATITVPFSFPFSERENSLWQQFIKQLDFNYLPHRLLVKDSQLRLITNNQNWHFNRVNLDFINGIPSSSYLNLKAYLIMDKGVLTQFNLEGSIDWTAPILTAKNMALMLWCSYNHVLYQNTIYFDVDADVAQGNIVFSDMKFSGRQWRHQMIYEGNISQLFWRRFRSLHIPKITLNFSQQKSPYQLEGFLGLLQVYCQHRWCVSGTNSYFNVDYKKNDTHLSLIGTSSLKWDLQKKSVLFQEFHFNAREFFQEEQRARWHIQLQGNFLYQWAGQRQWLIKAQGLFDQQNIELSFVHYLDWSFSLVNLNLAALDLRNYLTGDKNNTSKEVNTYDYNRLFMLAPKVFSWLKRQQVDAKISVGRLHCLNSDITDVSGLFIYRPNHMRLVNVAGKLFGGEILSQLEVMGGRNVSYQLQQKLTDIDIASLLLSRINVAYLSGKATAFITAQSMGKNIKTLLANLSGNMQLNVQHGMISGIESKQLLVLKADRQSRKLINKESQATASIPFDRLRIKSRWNNGISDYISLYLDGPQLQISGAGSASLINRLIDYSLLVKTPGMSSNQAMAIRMVGNFFSLEYSLDHKRLLEQFNQAQDKPEALRQVLKQQWNLFRNSL